VPRMEGWPNTWCCCCCCTGPVAVFVLALAPLPVGAIPNKLLAPVELPKTFFGGKQSYSGAERSFKGKR